MSQCCIASSRDDGVGDLATALTGRPLLLAASAVVGPIAATCSTDYIDVPILQIEYMHTIEYLMFSVRFHCISIQTWLGS